MTDHPETDDRVLVQEAQRDPRRFAGLYERHFEGVYAYAVSRLRHRAEAEDVTADVFHRALASIQSFEWRGVPFRAWLIRIAANLISDRYDRTQREGSALQNQCDIALTVQVEQDALLFRSVEKLPADQRRVIVARFVEQQSIREIAVELGRSEGAVKQLQLRALETLRELVGRSNA